MPSVIEDVLNLLVGVPSHTFQYDEVSQSISFSLDNVIDYEAKTFW